MMPSCRVDDTVVPIQPAKTYSNLDLCEVGITYHFTFVFATRSRTIVNTFDLAVSRAKARINDLAGNERESEE